MRRTHKPESSAFLIRWTKAAREPYEGCPVCLRFHAGDPSRASRLLIETL
jgi:hypothetical protein